MYKTVHVTEFLAYYYDWLKDLHDKNKAEYDAACAEYETKSWWRKILSSSPDKYDWGFFYINLKQYEHLLNEMIYLEKIGTETIYICKMRIFASVSFHGVPKIKSPIDFRKVYCYTSYPINVKEKRCLHYQKFCS